jgi:hypothetical protein
MTSADVAQSSVVSEVTLYLALASPSGFPPPPPLVPCLAHQGVPRRARSGSPPSRLEGPIWVREELEHVPR